MTRLAAVIAVALGTAAAASAWAVVYAGLWRPLPFADPAALVIVRQRHVAITDDSGFQLDEFGRLRAQVEGVARLAGYSRAEVTAGDGLAASDGGLAYVTGPFFEVLGLPVVAGHALEGEGPPDEVVVSHHFAEDLAGSAPAAIGRTVNAGARTFQIAGVLPASFGILDEGVDVWARAAAADPMRVLGHGDERNYIVIGRLGPGRRLVDLQIAAQRALEGGSSAEGGRWRAVVEPLRDRLVGDARHLLLAFLAAAALVLVAACANVAVLLVNRAVTRTREFAIRLALGAGRGDIVRTMAVETVSLTVVGAAIGGGLAAVAIRAIATATGFDIPYIATQTTRASVVTAAVVSSALVVVVCTAASALAVRPAIAGTSLRLGSATVSRAGRRLRAMLVVVQLATAATLLIGMGLLGRTLVTLSRTDLGLAGTDRVLTLRVPIGRSARADDAGRAEVLATLLRDVRALPGVQAAGVGSSLPPNAPAILFTIEQRSAGQDVTRRFDLVSGTDGYLDGLGAQLVRGRLFEPEDSARELPVAVLSESAVRFLGLQGDVIGHPLNMGLPSSSGRQVTPTIIGIIKDVRYTGLETPANGGVYVQWRQIPMPEAYLIVRGSGDPAALASAVTRSAQRADPSLRLPPAATFGSELDRLLAPRTARAALAAVFAGTALLLAVVGLSAALVRLVIERRRELAIRAAVGATPSALVRLVVGYGLALACVGSALGCGLSIVTARTISSMVAGVTPYDPVTYVAAVASVIVLAMGVSYVPARRAAGADPRRLLQSE